MAATNYEVTRRVRGRTLQKRRHYYFMRHPLCAACSKGGKVSLATELDHIIPLFKGGSDEPENFQGLCGSCHKDKTAKDLGRRRRSATGIDGYPIEA